jgi:hypothetical protein
VILAIVEFRHKYKVPWDAERRKDEGYGPGRCFQSLFKCQTQHGTVLLERRARLGGQGSLGDVDYSDGTALEGQDVLDYS